ncbi:AAA family ATPase [Bifidobacterium sp. ESL0790]|uniref:AAA family ATPase n=1 Tax=Bifidobacterium sp. ESL0790 TaxID=2983233 RepID=UPI0023F7B69B|nr:AAA family ATPase [Bifidobacterium sp. ESL0790]WEV72874.1 AAA family ATPase [Bifidobacterium sp. ESL0790]
MYLKELTLRGFKSFASATTLRFEPGITAVVGPNGSGKSNIVDALTWVMGEQGVKNLRGTSMEDVIFAGTSSRPPLGRAQVSLTIDNTDHTLDIDYTEVTISRTIYRNGGSEYAINGSACRLLDIQELLSDTGLGQQMHVIVGQGRLDEILKADPSGHRAFIEEAAGILKHRKRKERALRKLKHTEANLARTDDLLHEIHRQLGPLGRQAKISRRAQSIQVSLRDAQSRIYAEDSQKAMARRAGLRTELGQVRGQLEEAQRGLARVKMRIEQVEALSSESNPAITKVNETWHELTQLKERFESLASLADERARSVAGQMITNFGEDPDILEARAKELDGQVAEGEKTVSDARLTFDQSTERRADNEKQLAAARQTLIELRKAAQQRDNQIANLRELKAREESAIELADTRVKDFTAQRVTIAEQRDEAVAQRDKLDADTQRDGEDGAGDALDKAREELSKCQDELDAMQEQLRGLNAKVSAAKAKADAIDDTLESRNASGALRQDKKVAALGRLSDFIHVEPGWEEAVAHALEQFASAIVVPGEANMLEALRKASDDGLGKAVVLHPVDGDGNDGDGDDGVDATSNAHNDKGHKVSALVTANPKAKDKELASRIVMAVRDLLTDVGSADDMDEALKLVHDGQFGHVVTKNGEIVNRVGAIGGSSRPQSDLSLAARRDAALQQAEDCAAQIDELNTNIEKTTKKRDAARLKVDEESQKRMQAKLRAKQTQKDLLAAKERVTRFASQLDDIEAKIKRAQEDGQNHQLKLKDLDAALEQTRDADDGHGNPEGLDERVRGLEQALDKAREQETTAKITWNDAKRKIESLTRQAGLLHDNAREATARRARMKELNARRERQRTHSRAIAADARGMAQLVDAELRQVVAKRDELTQQASSHDSQLKELRGQRDTDEPKVAALQAKEHELDVTRERVAAQYGQLQQKVSDDLGMGLDELAEAYGPAMPVPVLDENGQPVPLEGVADDDEDSDIYAGSDAENANVVDANEDMTDSADSAGSDDAHIQTQGMNPVNPSSFTDPDFAEHYQTVPYVRAEQEKRLKKAQRDLAALGKINPLATEEYDSLEARNKYLNDQRNDVVKSRDDLMKLIKDLDQTMVEVFKSAFDDTAAAFEKVFATLFPGGKGQLRLENPDDLLTTGVIVEASPAGKRVKQLSLLSGGERSLTALALLFAIFTARPSPFYVMDEVEAALDDINLTRLINAFNDLRQHAQLIIITHQQRTMSIADALYGVTMRSDGVTAVISQKLEHE